MSYKHNQADPRRRARILARQRLMGHPGVVGPQAPKYNEYGTPMKRSNRNAMLRFMIANKGRYHADWFVPLANLVRSGYATRNQVYNFGNRIA